jgi:hypothetical protein
MIGGRVPDRGWKRPFDEPIPLPDGRQLVTLEDAGTEGRARGDGMASGDTGLDPGRDEGRADDASADRDHARTKPSRRTRLRTVGQKASLGKAEAEERRVNRIGRRIIMCMLLIGVVSC